MIDRKKFFDGVRFGPFDGKLTKEQVSGMGAILGEWERRKAEDLRHLAYMLATTKWETAHTMQPIKERGGVAYFTRMYDPSGSRPTFAKRHGNTSPGDGPKYCGRGYVQLTWKNNYKTMTKALQKAGFDVDLVENPDMAMQHDVAAFILFEGMLRGSFTGKRLYDFFNEKVTDWWNARKIINGVDHARDIGEIAKQFYADLTLAV